MKKETRDLKKHYRGVERKVVGFKIDLSDGSWYNLWHTHLDWYGITTHSEKHRVRHLGYYNMLLEKIEKQTLGCERKFQAWIFIDGIDGGMDAIFVHTENPCSEFPYNIDEIEWNLEIPSFIKKVFDLDTFNIGRLKSEESYSYLIEKKGLGVSLFKL